MSNHTECPSCGRKIYKFKGLGKADGSNWFCVARGCNVVCFECHGYCRKQKSCEDLALYRASPEYQKRKEKAQKWRKSKDEWAAKKLAERIAKESLPSEVDFKV